ncbi:MAG: FG-GAP repeat protein [Anaerolineae bacterium]|nr:FG-GAP repeat protein [Anaerolineae bacterium]
MFRHLIFAVVLALALMGAAFGLLSFIGQSGAYAAPAEFRVCNTTAGFSATIQSAVDAALPGDIIKVARGVYTETQPTPGFTYNLFITKTVHLFGGYTCNDWTTRNYTANVTTIRPADPTFAVVTIQGSFANTAAATPTLDGFTITGARSDNHGGGLRMHDSNALIRNNVITGNVAYFLGGGVWVQRGAPRFENNRIANNLVTPSGTAYGGGIELEGTRATLVGNVIAGNVVSSTQGYGGGVAIDGGGPVLLSGNTISANAAANQAGEATERGYGGGVSVFNAPVTLSNNVIQGNTANLVTLGFGGGVYINGAAFTLTGNTVMSNTGGFSPGNGPYLAGGGVFIETSSGLLTGNVLTGNRANRNTIFGNGGGLAAFTSTLSVRGGQILNNSASLNCEGYGGGLYAYSSRVTIDTTRVENNCAANTPFYGLGGGLAFISSPYTLTNMLIVRNFSFGNDTAVGGLYAGANSPGVVVNNTMANNRGQGIRVGSPLTLTNNIIMSHTTGVSLTAAVPVSVTYNDFYANTTNQRGFSLDVTNIVINPQLNANHRLLPSSPLLDAGTRTNAPDHDVDGQPRIMAGPSGFFRVDIGADEGTGPPQTVRNLGTNPADFTLIGPGNPQDNPDSTGPDDFIGYAMLGANVNGDGLHDLIVGAPNLSDDFEGAVNDSGRIFALYNNRTRRLGVYDLYTGTANLEVRSWLHQQHIGQAFAANDMDGDGLRDLIIGSQGGDDNGKPVTGTVFIFKGGPGLAGTRTLSPTMQANWRIRSKESTQTFAGRNALAVGQLTVGGSPADLAVGEALATGPGNRAEAGAVYVFFGSTGLPALWDLRVLSASLTIYGPAANDQLGMVAIAEVNADNQPDLVVRSQKTAYVFFGPLAAGAHDLATTPADATITDLGNGLLAAGDVDGDGRADLVIGSGGEVEIVRGANLTGTKTLAQASWARFTGGNAAVGFSALQAMDWNGDSKAEVVIGERSKGRVLVIFGSTTLTGTANLLDRAAWIINGENPQDLFGYSLGSGDLDADGTLDLILGTRKHEVQNHPNNFKDAGAVYVLYGARGVSPFPTPTPTPTPAVTATPTRAPTVTPTRTPTRPPKQEYLPLVLRRR